MNIGSLEVMLGVNTAGLSRAAVNMRRFESQVASMSAKMMTAGVLMTQFFTAPIAIFAGASTKAFADFEESLGKMAALTSFTTDQIKTMADEILRMTGQVGRSPKELAEGLYFIGSSGITDQAMAMDILTKSANASRIGLGETKVVADALTSVINAYGKEAITAGQATDIMVAAVREGKGEADALTRVFGHVMPLAVQLGVSFDQVAGSLATLTLSGKSASEASTQLARLFTTLIQASPRSEAALERFGISFKNLRKTLREGGMIAFMEQLKEMIGGNTLDVIENSKAYEDNIGVLGNVFTNIRALLPVLDMMGPNFDNLKRVLGATGNAAYSLNNGVVKVAETFKDKWKRSVGDLTASLISFGSVLQGPVMEIMSKFTDFIGKLANKFAALPASTQQTAIAFGMLTAALGPLMLVFGPFVTLVKTLFTFLISGSLMSVVTLFFMFGAAVYYTYKNWDMLNKLIDNQWYKHAVEGIKESQKALDVLNAKWQNYFDTLKQSGTISQDVATDVESMLNKESELADLHTKMNALPETDHFNRQASYNQISDKLDEIYTLRKKIMDLDSRASGSVNVMDLKDITRIEKAIAQFNVGTKLADQIKEDNVTLSDYLKAFFTSIGSDIVDGVNYLQEKITGIDLSTLRSGINIGNSANDIISFPVKITPQFIMPEEDDFQAHLLSMAKAFDPAIIDAALGFERLSLTMNNVDTDLAQNAEMAKLLGSGYDQAGVAVTILGEALDKLLNKPTIDMMTPEMLENLKRFLDLYNELNKAQDDSTKKLAAWKNMFSALSSLVGSLSKYMSEEFQKVFQTISDGIQIIAQVVQLIKAVGIVIDVMSKKKVVDNAVTASGIPVTLGLATAQETLAAAEVQTGIAGFFAAHSWIPFVGIGLALAGIATMIIVMNKKKQLPKMANGGIVPDGFSNDKFPAMLNSGEMVIPLKKVAEIFGNEQGTGNKEVVFKIHRKELVGILQDAATSERSF